MMPARSGKRKKILISPYMEHRLSLPLINSQNVYRNVSELFRVLPIRITLPTAIMCNVTENIDAFTKLKFESQFQALSPGGAISYVEVPNMQDNLDAVFICNEIHL